MRQAAANALGIFSVGLAVFALGVVLIIDTITWESVRWFASRVVFIPLGLLLMAGAIWWTIGRVIWER